MLDKESNKDITYRAIEYAQTKQQSPFRRYVEKFTLFSLIGDPRYLRIVDAGCGDGLYARELIDRGASHLLGIDCNSGFIELARQKNRQYEDYIRYVQAFMQDTRGEENFDVVLGSFLLNYAQSAEDIQQYCRAIASYLKPGGRFVGLNNNPFETFHGERYAKYGFTKTMNESDEGVKEGAEVVYFVEGMSDPIVNYYLSPETHEQAFQEYGMTLEWRRALLHPRESNNPYWDEFFQQESPFIGMVAVKR